MCINKKKKVKNFNSVTRKVILKTIINKNRKKSNIRQIFTKYVSIKYVKLNKHQFNKKKKTHEMDLYLNKIRLLMLDKKL